MNGGDNVVVCAGWLRREETEKGSGLSSKHIGVLELGRWERNVWSSVGSRMHSPKNLAFTFVF